MGIYLGIIDIKRSDRSDYYNYRPLYELRNGTWYQLTTFDKAKLLPDSFRRDINFSYDWTVDSQIDFMQTRFPEKILIIFEFAYEDLQDNISLRGDRYPTGYKVIAEDMINKGKIRTLDEDGFFPLVQENEIVSDFKKDAIVEIGSGDLTVESRVFVSLGDFYAGPYAIKYREMYRGINESYYIRPQIKENKYTIRGYRKENCLCQEIIVGNVYRDSLEERRFILVSPKAPDQIEYLDTITNEVLLESFKDSIGNDTVGGGKISVTDIGVLLENYKTSSLVGEEITAAIRKDRMNRIAEILTSEAELDNTLRLIAESLCDLLVKYKTSPGVDELIESIVAGHPDFFDQMKGTRVIREKIAELEEQQDSLMQKNMRLDEEIDAKREAAALEEAREKQLSELSEEYIAKKAELDSVTGELAVANNISDLKKEIQYLDTHKNHLESDTRNLETEFLERINNHHEKMVGISFDGWIANKMLQAAAQWENGEIQRDYIKSVGVLNRLEVTDKEPEQLVRYLCDTVRIIRPQYSRNTIINIAICLTQGFLTVFSGEPGSGKTSICNIFADVLGLNKLARLANPYNESGIKLNRFIAVSVERGWTSKRDLIGYFNPLSKTFDKNNRRVYDALKLLDLEKREGLQNYPFIILLDEANLSPMEYYWADFMNACDDLENNGYINLGDDNVFSIPETLHFAATINNDHTTETLSPRLIDRAWVIMLPHYATLTVGKKVDEKIIEPLTWHAIKKAFVHCADAKSMSSSPETQKIFDTVILTLRKARIIISPRTEIAIKKYWSMASIRLEKDEYGNDASIVALDYAIAQKILPKIAGTGEVFAKWLEELRNICSSNNLNISAKIVKDIFDRGNDQMKYYHFF